MKPFDFWQKWILGVGVCLVAFGATLAFFPHSQLMDTLLNDHINVAFWSDAESIAGGTARYRAWIYGVLGATIAGLGIILTFISRYPFKARERWAWNCIAIAFGFWYAVDTPISALYGVWFNVLFNTALLLAVAIPLAATRREF